MSAGRRFRRHPHEGGHVCVVVAGGFLERQGRSWVDVGPGSMRISGGARHDIDFGPAGATCVMLESEDPLVTALPRPLFLDPDPWVGRLGRRIASTVGRGRRLSPIIADGLAAELLAQARRRLEGRHAPPPPWLQEARAKLDRAEGRVSVSALAAEAGVHRVHLARSFRDHFGTSASEHARRLRVERARRLLELEPAALAHVALEAGFADQSHLTREMRALLGITPAALRATLHPFKIRFGVRD